MSFGPYEWLDVIAYKSCSACIFAGNHDLYLDFEAGGFVCPAGGSLPGPEHLVQEFADGA
jgi:hypothetical protein